MPEGTATVLDLDGGVTAEQYTTAMQALANDMERFRNGDDITGERWCTEFWTWIGMHISPAFTYEYRSGPGVNAGTVGDDDASRAKELRDIRGRILGQVALRDSLSLERANQMLAAAGLPQYADPVQRTWNVRLPGISLDISAETDPTEGLRAKVTEFLTGLGYEDATYAASRVFAARGNARVDPAQTVPLLNGDTA